MRKERQEAIKPVPLHREVSVESEIQVTVKRPELSGFAARSLSLCRGWAIAA